MNEVKLAEYCRQKGLFVEKIATWKVACMNANASSVEQQKQAKEQSRQGKQTIKALEKELTRKEKALAETAALLVLRKNANATWGPG